MAQAPYVHKTLCAQANRRATRVQAHVRGHLTRTRFRKATELGRRQAARAAAEAARVSAAVAIQKHVRRRIAQRKVCLHTGQLDDPAFCCGHSRTGCTIRKTVRMPCDHAHIPLLHTDWALHVVL